MAKKENAGKFKPNDPRLLGNQFGVGANSGRPRTVSPPPDQCHELGEEMVKWVRENNPTHLSEWYSLEKMIPWKTWNAMCEVPEFLPYYEVALNLVAKASRDGTLDKSIAQRFLSLYHRDMKKEERDDVQHKADANRRSEVEVSGSTEMNVLFGFSDNTSKDLVSKDILNEKD